MAGTLLHARTFERDWYTGNDGFQHYELVPRDGDGEVMSNSSWRETIAYFGSIGVPQHLWPTYECNIDLPLPQIISQSEELRKCVNRVELDSRCSRWAEMAFRIIRSGEVLFYCIE